MPNFDFKFDGNDIPGSLAKLLKYMNWFTQHLDETNIKSYAWGDSQADNVDATHRLKLKFYVPDSIIKVQKLLLNFSIEAFRAYETGAASGGDSQITSLNSDFDYDLVTLGATWHDTNTDGVQAYTSNDGIELHSHPFSISGTTSTEQDNPVDDPHSHTFSGSGNTGDEGGHFHNVEIYSHYHDLLASGLQHTHDIDLPVHTHDMSYGIYESTSAAGIKIYVDGSLRIDNGGVGYSADQANLDLTQWVTTAGWHTIELSSSRLGRINAAYFIQIYAGANGI